MSIHTRIKERRIAVGFASQEAFAKAIDVSWQTVQQWEKEGGTAPNRNRIGKVAKALNTTPEWLMHGSGEGADPPTEPRIVRPAAPPKWMDAEAYQLLELYYACDVETRKSISVYIRALGRGADSGAASNEG